MRNPILIGQVQVSPSMKTGQVWLDKNAKIGLIIAETEDAFQIQTADRIVEIVPKVYQSQFEETVDCLGEL